MSDQNRGGQAPPALRPAVERGLDRLMDRIEDRIWSANEGTHLVHPGASLEELQALQIPAELGYFWTRFDGMELAYGEVEVARLSQIPEWTKAHAQFLRPGDRVIGRRGQDLYVLPEDPWSEGAVVVLVDEVKSRGPLASSVGHWILALLGEFTLLFDDKGEYRDALFDESTGVYTPDTQRKLLRRRLDMDPDGALARFELGQLLRAQGELRAAVTELKRAIKVAPEFAWSHYELGRCHFELGQLRPAQGCFEQAAEFSEEVPGLFALCRAWQIRCFEDPEDPQITRLRQEIVKREPDFAKEQLDLALELLEHEDPKLVLEFLELGLAVAPTDLSLLAMRQRFVDADPDEVALD